MLKSLVVTGFFVGLIAMLFITPAKYAQGIFKLEYGELSLADKVKSWIPIYNITKSELLYTGKFSLILVSTITFLVSLGIRFACVFLAPSVLPVQLASILLLFIMFLFWYGSNFYAVFIVLNDSGTASILACILRSLFFPLGQYYIGTYLATVMKNYAKKEAVFK